MLFYTAGHISKVPSTIRHKGLTKQKNKTKKKEREKRERGKKEKSQKEGIISYFKKSVKVITAKSLKICKSVIKS